MWQKIREALQSWWGKCPGQPLREGTPEFDLYMTEAELKQGNLRHGAHHLASLLSVDPGHDRGRQLADQYIAAAGEDPVTTLCGPTPQDEAYFADEALRAYVMARQGRVIEAVGLLTQVVAAKPDASYLESWALDWMQQPGVLERMPSDLFYLAVAKMQIRYPEHPYLTAAQHKPLEKALALVERYQRRVRPAPEEQIWRAALNRKLGRFKTALDIGQAAYDSQPKWQTAIPCGLALREMGELERAREAFELALAHDPEDLAARLEVADMYLEDQQWEEAAKWYAEVLAREVDHPWASASIAYCDYRLGHEESAARTLNELRREGCLRADQLVERLLPYSGSLPLPTDATANLLTQLIDKLRESPDSIAGQLRVSLSHLEAPSNYLAFRMQMEASGAPAELELEVQTIARPDPRRSDGPVSLLLWTYDGIKPSPAVGPPGEQVLSLVEALAREPYDPRRNWARASLAMQQLGAERAEELAAAMVHPPDLPPGWTALEWIPRTQLVTAQMLAHLDEGWQGSRRKTILFDLIRGPIDWTTEAVIITLAQLSQEAPESSADIDREFERLAARRADSGACSFEFPLFYHWIDLPSLPATRRDELYQVLHEIEEKA